MSQIIWRLRHNLYKNVPILKKQSQYPRKRIFKKIYLRSPSIQSNFFIANNLTAHFLNLSHQFDRRIDWAYMGNGALWTYNLNYFDFLSNPQIDQHYALQLINDFIDNSDVNSISFDSHPISVRLINWIKFLVLNEIQNEKIDNSISQQADILANNIEYHLLGNHLLENAFGLFFSAIYFDDKKLLQKASEILLSELEEQFIPDGCHFELSPMYHQIMLYRMLDCINLTLNSSFSELPVYNKLIEKSSRALGWLNAITFQNGNIPLVNDSANKIAPTTKELNEYATSLRIVPTEVKPNECGYRMFRKNNYELFIDIGNIGPDYIPGHAHSDTFSFILQIENQPIIVDTGISTYEKNEIRQKERGTSAHNTVKIGNIDQSEVWGGFRVGRRAKIIELEEDKDLIRAVHNGYKHLGAFHQRIFQFMNNNQIIIQDKIFGNPSENALAFFHFHPNIKPELSGNILKCQKLKIHFHSKINPILEKYDYAEGFNLRHEAWNIKVQFQKELETKIEIL